MFLSQSLYDAVLHPIMYCITRRQAAYEDHLETIESELKLDIKNRKYSTQFVSYKNGYNHSVERGWLQFQKLESEGFKMAEIKELKASCFEHHS